MAHLVKKGLAVLGKPFRPTRRGSGTTNQMIIEGGTTMTKISFTMAMALTIFIFPTFLHGASFPARPLEVVVPFGAGGASDIFARQYCKVVEKYIPKPIKVINKAGGGTVEGMTYVFNQPPDGYTILEITPSLIIGEVLGKSSIRFRESFDPLLRVQSDIVALGVSSKSKFKTIQELLDFAKQNPGKLKIAGISPGGLDDYIANAFAQKAGVKFTYVPFKSGSAIKAAVLGGAIDVYQDKLISFLSLARSGDVRPLIVLNDKRLTMVPELQNVPCTVERGINFTQGSWRGFCVKKGTAKEIKKYLIEAFEKGQKDKAYRDMEMKEMTHLRPGYLSAEDFRKSWDSEYAALRDIFKQTGLIK
jgi:putative tricarboxylic transport membrane protein